MNNYLGFDARRRFRNGRGKLLELEDGLGLWNLPLENAALSGFVESILFFSEIEGRKIGCNRFV